VNPGLRKVQTGVEKVEFNARVQSAFDEAAAELAGPKPTAGKAVVENTESAGKAVVTEHAPSKPKGVADTESTLTEAPVSEGVAHGQGATSVEELSLGKQGKYLSYNPKTRQFSASGSGPNRSDPSDGVILQVKQNGEVNSIGGGNANKGIRDQALEKAKKIWPEYFDSPAKPVKPPEQVKPPPKQATPSTTAEEDEAAKEFIESLKKKDK